MYKYTDPYYRSNYKWSQGVVSVTYKQVGEEPPHAEDAAAPPVIPPPDAAAEGAAAEGAAAEGAAEGAAAAPAEDDDDGDATKDATEDASKGVKPGAAGDADVAATLDEAADEDADDAGKGVKPGAAGDDDDDEIDNPLLAAIQKGITLKKVALPTGAPPTGASDTKAGQPYAKSDEFKTSLEQVKNTTGTEDDTLGKKSLSYAISEWEESVSNLNQIFDKIIIESEIKYNKFKISKQKADSFIIKAETTKSIAEYKQAVIEYEALKQPLQNNIDFVEDNIDKGDILATNIEHMNYEYDGADFKKYPNLKKFVERRKEFKQKLHDFQVQFDKDMTDINKNISSVKLKIIGIEKTTSDTTMEKLSTLLQVLKQSVSQIVIGKKEFNDVTPDIQTELQKYDKITKPIFGTIGYEMSDNDGLLLYMKNIKQLYNSDPELDELDILIKSLEKKIKEDDLASASEDWGGGGHIKKKLIRKKTYRNVSKITNNTSRKRTKLTELFKTKRNKNKTLRKK